MALLRSPPIKSSFFIPPEDHESRSDDENEEKRSAIRGKKRKAVHVHDRRDFEVEAENMEVNRSNNKWKKEKGNGENGGQKKKIKQNTATVEDPKEADDPKEINERYENVEYQASLVNLINMLILIRESSHRESDCLIY